MKPMSLKGLSIQFWSLFVGPLDGFQVKGINKLSVARFPLI